MPRSAIRLRAATVATTLAGIMLMPPLPSPLGLFAQYADLPQAPHPQDPMEAGFGSQANFSAGQVRALAARQCVRCHGRQGEGDAEAAVPRLAGQPRQYLAAQLRHFASGARAHPVMSPIARRLDERQIERLAAWYAKANAVPQKQLPPPFPSAYQRGLILATVGDRRLGVPACIDCHGRATQRGRPAIPDLAALPRTYMIVALAEWQNGIRATDPTRRMNAIAARLNHGDMQALAAYYGEQVPPGRREPEDEFKPTDARGTAAWSVAPTIRDLVECRHAHPDTRPNPAIAGFRQP